MGVRGGALSSEHNCLLLSACFILKEFPGTVCICVQAAKRTLLGFMSSFRWDGLWPLRALGQKDFTFLPGFYRQPARRGQFSTNLPFFFPLTLFFFSDQRCSGTSESAGVFCDFAQQCHYRKLQYAASGMWSICVGRLSVSFWQRSSWLWWKGGIPLQSDSWEVLMVMQWFRLKLSTVVLCLSYSVQLHM